MRIFTGVLVLVLAGWFLSALVDAPEESAMAQSASPTEWISSEQCAECHQQIYDEWISSPHANSWNNEDVRVQSNHFAKQACIDCHAPRPVFETKIGERVLPRPARRSEGVDCITCHLTPEGTMAGTITNPRAACQPVMRRELQRVDLCASCHNQHKTVEQWKETPFADHREGCMECHMPYRDGTPEGGRVHTMPGGHYIEMVRAAVELDVEREEDGTVTVSLTNTSGHAYPTDERSRASDVWWRPVDEAGEPNGRWRNLHRIRDPYRHETDMVSTLLHYGEIRELELDDPAAQGSVEVMLVYKRAPYYRDGNTGQPLRMEDVDDPLEDAELVHSAVVGPKL
ncbi:MAG: multiheme c-type cytochrome [Planctomycetota bacterium]